MIPTSDPRRLGWTLPSVSLHRAFRAGEHLFKAVLFLGCCYLILRSYTRKVLKPSVLKMYKFGFWLIDDLLDMVPDEVELP